MRVQMFSPFFIFFFVLSLLPSFNPLSSEVLKLPSNKTIVSPRNVYEFGFFQPDKLVSRWYLGIWFKEDPNRTCLWVANRDLPLLTPTGTFRFFNNDLILFDEENAPVWSTNLTRGRMRSQMVAELLDNGNLVLKDPNNPKEGYLWQSFDHPTDTLLPDMKLGVGPAAGIENVLKPWYNTTDPSSGGISLGIESEYAAGLFAIYLSQSLTIATKYWSTSVWNGYQFGDMPPILKLDKTGLWFLMTTYLGNYSRLTLGQGWSYDVYTWIPEEREWKLVWSTSKDDCYAYDHHQCGLYSFCSKNTSPLCNCIPGFSPGMDPKTDGWSGGCGRKTALRCNDTYFLQLKNMKLPEKADDLIRTKLSVETCKSICLMKCDKCTAFALVELRKGQTTGLCVIWDGVLNGMQNYTVGGHDLYVRVAAKDLEATKETKSNKSAKLSPLGIGLMVGGIVLFILLCMCLWKRMKRDTSEETQGPSETEIMMNEIVGEDRFSFMEFRTIVEATDNFSQSNQLGRGGFGIVYKGILQNGTQVAVKRLSHMSFQGVVEFKNEVRTVLNVLHKNLVRLLGCCCQGVEKILVYEYLENSSLNRYLFNETRSQLLNWENRFRIISEIAQGLSYLHNSRDSPIIHRDLKPSNILLDINMTAKISDFGLAKILESGQTETETQQVVGTYGYMSEEYAVSNIMSEKADIFSFGVVILEIITGQQNFKFCNTFPGDSILGLAWRSWKGGNGLQLVDSHFVDDSLVDEEVLRCIQIGLCCVQAEAENRPNTDELVVMLKSRTAEITQPQDPNYFYAKSLGRVAAAASSSSSVIREIESSVLTESSDTVNEITLTTVGVR